MHKSPKIRKQECSLVRLLLIVGLVLQSTISSAQSCNNNDIELSPAAVITQTNQVIGWTAVAGSVSAANNVCNLGGCCPSPPAESAVINCNPINGYVDPNIGGVWPLYSVFGSGSNNGNGVNPGLPQMGGTKILRINSSLNNYSLERLSKTFTVTTSSNLFKFAFASVFSTGHGCCDGSQFKIVLTVSGNTVACPSFSIAGPSAACTTVTPSQFYLPGTGNPWAGTGTYVFNKWMINSIDLSSYLGQEVSIDFMAADCTAGGHYGYTYIDTQCGSMELVANQNSYPIAGSGATLSSCGAAAFTLTAPYGMGPYSWNSGQITIPANYSTPSNTNIMLVCNQSGTLALTMNPLLGCGPVTKTLNLSITPAANTIAVNNVSLCLGQTATLSASGLNTYTWSTAAVSPSIIVSPTVNTSYTVTGSNLSNCTNSAVVQASVFALPLVNVTGNTTVCAGSSSNFTFSGANSYSLNGNATASTVNILPLNSTNYTVTGINQCGMDTQAFNLFVDAGCANVWPGDANSDGVANNLDVLELGLDYNQTGPSRISAGNLWQSYYAGAWTGTITNGKNLCHANCNGDGIINSADTIAVFQNYNLTHAFKNQGASVIQPQIYLQAEQAYVGANEWANIGVYLGDSLNAVSLNGVAFTINYENVFIQADSVSIGYPVSFFNVVNDNLHFRKNNYANGLVYAASTHTNNTDISGTGKIAHFRFKTKAPITSDTVVKLNITAAYKSLSSGILFPLSTGSVAVNIKAGDVGLNEAGIDGGVSVFPNPTRGLITLKSTSEIKKIEVIDQTGKILSSKKVNDSAYTIDLQSYAPGIYFARIHDAKGTHTVKIVRSN